MPVMCSGPGPHRPLSGYLGEGTNNNARCSDPACEVRATTAEIAAEIAAKTNKDTIYTRATAALLVNRTYLALTAPSGADNLAQVRALTRQNVGLIRLLLNNLDGVD